MNGDCLHRISREFYHTNNSTISSSNLKLNYGVDSSSKIDVFETTNSSFHLAVNYSIDGATNFGLI